MQVINIRQLAKAKRAASTRRIDLSRARTLLSTGIAPAAGDLVLARVTKTGHHDGLELLCGRRATLYEGDHILVCYANRYAPDQFEAVVPEDQGPCHLVAAGGLAGKALSWHAGTRAPTEITPLGIVADEAKVPLNIRQFCIPGPAVAPQIPVIISVGTSMNSGKTTTAARLIYGLTKAGRRVGAAKVTGTSAGKDTWLMRDSGALAVFDFNDAGFATTYLERMSEIEDGAFRLVNSLERAGCDIAVLEVADGLLQAETKALLERPRFKAMVTSVVFSSVDSMGAVSGAVWLKSLGYHVATLAGVMTNSPLAAREAAAATGLLVTPLRDFENPSVVGSLFADSRQTNVAA